MSWESRNGRGRYYTRSRRRGGKIVREYLGTGQAAELAAKLDALHQKEFAKAKQARLQREAEADALDASVAVTFDAIELVARAALNAAGYHQHHRGNWRKSRENRSKPE